MIAVARLGGFDPGDIRPDFLRRKVALVQGTEVFQGTIAENVHRPEVSPHQVRDAVERVGLLEPVLSLKDSQDSQLSSGGHPLSENRCRLLNLARAIAGEPRLLLIDGVLDALSDEELGPVLDHLTREETPWTLVIATGRESITFRCAQQYRLSGSPRPLLQRQPVEFLVPESVSS